MAVKYTVSEFKNFGKCVCIDNGAMELYVTVDIGPRIIKLNLKGKDNMMFCDESRSILRDASVVSDMFGEGSVWYIYGGHRFWLSPEKYPETYYPDNEPVTYIVDGNKFTFHAPKQRFTGWQESMILEVDENDAKVSVKHVLVNMSDRTQKASVWGIKVTDKGGVAYIKQAKEDTGLLSNRNLVVWPYSDLTDNRFCMDNEYFILKQDTKAKNAFKFGTNNTNGVTLCVNHETVFKITAEYVKGAEYPDYGSSSELYSCADFLEVETLSPLYTLKPGEVCEHVEKWELIPEKSTDFDKLKRYF